MGKSINKSILATTGLVSITACTGFVLMSSYVSADDVVDDVSVTVPMSCTMSGSGMASHTAEITNGTYQANIGTTTINALCNDNAGFSIYAAGFSGEVIGGTNSNKLIGTSASSNATIDTGTATGPGSQDVSNWAMQLATNSQATYPITLTTGYDAYHAVPNEYTKVATRLTGTDVGTGATGSTLTTTYAAYISKTQPADTYSGKVIYTLVHPNDAPTPTPPPTPPTSCTTPVPNLTYMQDLNSSNKATVLSNMTEDSQYYLADKRDNKAYCVAKLKDGNIWMTQNLDHDIDSTKTYTSADTDITANWQPMRSTYATNDTTWDTEGEYGYTSPESYDPGELYWSGTPGDDIPVSTGNSHYHLGNYYNWTAAVAMNDSSSYVDDEQDVNQSICPANWTLPKSGYDTPASTAPGSFRYLVTQYGWDSSTNKMENPNIWNSPIKTSLSGLWSGSLVLVGMYDYSWSPMVDDGYSSCNLAAEFHGVVYPVHSSNPRVNGVSVRCLAR